MTNCPPHISKKPRDSGGRGFRGRHTRGVPGGLPPIKRKASRGVVVFHPEGTSLLHSSTVIEPNHSAFPVSLASSQGYISKRVTGFEWVSLRCWLYPYPSFAQFSDSPAFNFPLYLLECK